MLQIKDLNFQIGPKKILKDFNLTIAPGQMTAIIGPNGAGKTSLLRIIAGLEKNFYGQVFIKNKPIQDHSLKQRAQTIAYLTQSQHLSFAYQAIELVMMGRFSYQNKTFGSSQNEEKKALVALKKVGCFNLARRNVQSLSGGERQRVLIARTLNQNTPLILLDEPLNHIDIHHQIKLLQILKELKNKGVSTLCVLHQFNLIPDFFDNILVLTKNQESFLGPCHEILHHQKTLKAFDLEENQLRFLF